MKKKGITNKSFFNEKITHNKNIENKLKNRFFSGILNLPVLIEQILLSTFFWIFLWQLEWLLTIWNKKIQVISQIRFFEHLYVFILSRIKIFSAPGIAKEIKKQWHFSVCKFFLKNEGKKVYYKKLVRGHDKGACFYFLCYVVFVHIFFFISPRRSQEKCKTIGKQEKKCPANLFHKKYLNIGKHKRKGDMTI